MIERRGQGVTEAGKKRKREQQRQDGERGAVWKQQGCMSQEKSGRRQHKSMIITRLGQYERWQEEIIKESMWSPSKNPWLEKKQSLQSMAILAFCIICCSCNEAVADNRL